MITDLNYWINFKDYSISALFFNGVGCLFWLVAYITLVKEIRQKQFVQMPAFVAAANFAWEFVWSIFFAPDTGMLFVLAYQGAFVLDIYIFWNILKYGDKQVDTPELKKYFKTLSVVNLFVWIIVCYFFTKCGYDTSIGATSGYILNVIISVSYPILILSISDNKLFSYTLAWSKMLGTGLITVSMFLIYPNNYFIQILGVICLILDCFSIFLIKIRLKNLTL